MLLQFLPPSFAILSFFPSTQDSLRYFQSLRQNLYQEILQWAYHQLITRKYLQWIPPFSRSWPSFSKKTSCTRYTMEGANLLHSSSVSIAVAVFDKTKLTWHLQPFGVIDAQHEVWAYLLFKSLIFICFLTSISSGQCFVHLLLVS